MRKTNAVRERERKSGEAAIGEKIPAHIDSAQMRLASEDLYERHIARDNRIAGVGRSLGTVHTIISARSNER